MAAIYYVSDIIYAHKHVVQSSQAAEEEVSPTSTNMAQGDIRK